MARSTYCDQFKVLLNKGYLVQVSGNTYEFYEVPQTTADGFDEMAKTYPDVVNKKTPVPDNKNTTDVLPCPDIVSVCTGENREINNINTLTDNGTNNTVTNNNQQRRKREAEVNGEIIEFYF